MLYIFDLSPTRPLHFCIVAMQMCEKWSERSKEARKQGIVSVVVFIGVWLNGINKKNQLKTAVKTNNPISKQHLGFDRFLLFTGAVWVYETIRAEKKERKKKNLQKRPEKSRERSRIGRTTALINKIECALWASNFGTVQNMFCIGASEKASVSN